MKNMNMEDQKMIDEFAKTRGLKDSTKKQYTFRLKCYANYFNTSLKDLIEEAEDEEEEGIRWKKRKLKKRLVEYRNYLAENYLKSTVKHRFHSIVTFYKYHEIEIHDLPSWNEKALNKPQPISYSDLPDSEIIREAINLSDNLMKAMILFMSSSGCARTETLNLKIEDFINATKNYHNASKIQDVLTELDDCEDIIPLFRLKRQKTNKYYFTFCSPEAVQAIITYLKSRDNEKTIKNEDALFRISPVYTFELFQKLNDSMNLGKVGTFNRFRSHMLRKYHASQLYNDGMSLEMVDALQGRGKDSTHSSYFMEDPEKLKQEYVKHMDCLMINWNSVTYKSPEFVQLEMENDKYKKALEDLDRRVAKIENRPVDDDIKDLLNMDL